MTDLSFINAAGDELTDAQITAILNDDTQHNNQRDALADVMLQLFADSTSDQPDLIRSMLLGETIGAVVLTFTKAMEDDAKLEAFRALIADRAGLPSPLTQNALLTSIDPAAEGTRLAKIITDAITDEGMLGVIAATLINSIIAGYPHLRGPLKTLIDGVFDDNADAPLPA